MTPSRSWSRALSPRLAALAAGASLLVSPLSPAAAAPVPAPEVDAPTVEPPAVDTTTVDTPPPPKPAATDATPPAAPAPAATGDSPIAADPSAPPQPVDGLSRGSAFAVRAAERLDPYGPRPDGVPQLSREQVMRYALDNPLVHSAKEQVEAMKAQARKAKWAWLPVIETAATLTPGANIECDDFNVSTTGAPAEFKTFQWCRPGGDSELDIQTIRGYFQQLSRAGVRVAFDADAVFPIFTFGKIRNTKRLAKAGVALKELEVLQYQQETIKLVLQAHTTLLLARESQVILRDAKDVVDKATARVEAELGGGTEDDWDAEPTDSNRDPNDRIKVELASIEVEQKMREALRAEALALAALWDLAGAAAPRGFDVREDRLEPYVVDGGLRPLTEYRELAIRERPEAHMARAAVEARMAQEKLARAAFLPDLGLVVGVGFAVSNAVDREMSTLYYQDRFNYSRVTAALAMRWRWDFHNTVFDLQKARAELRSQEYQREAAELFLGQDVTLAYQDVVEADHRIELAARATALSWQLVVSLEQRDMVGGGDAEKLILALNGWYEKRFAEAEAIHDHNEAVARLSRAVGTSLTAPPRSPAASPAAPAASSASPAASP